MTVVWSLGFEFIGATDLDILMNGIFQAPLKALDQQHSMYGLDIVILCALPVLL